MTSRAISATRLHRLIRLQNWPGLVQLSALARSRKGLARLDDHLLRDIGLTRDQADAESIRPIWDVPPHWKG